MQQVSAARGVAAQQLEAVKLTEARDQLLKETAALVDLRDSLASQVEDLKVRLRCGSLCQLAQIVGP